MRVREMSRDATKSSRIAKKKKKAWGNKKTRSKEEPSLG
jgi:hypothetical protein